MDPLTAAIGALLTIITIGGGFIFARQESRIKVLEARVDVLADEHMVCEQARSKLEEKVFYLEAEIVRLKKA